MYSDVLRCCFCTAVEHEQFTVLFEKRHWALRPFFLMFSPSASSSLSLSGGNRSAAGCTVSLARQDVVVDFRGPPSDVRSSSPPRFAGGAAASTADWWGTASLAASPVRPTGEVTDLSGALPQGTVGLSASCVIAVNPNSERNDWRRNWNLVEITDSVVGRGSDGGVFGRFKSRRFRHVGGWACTLRGTVADLCHWNA
jgi:hypothetical protein